MALSPNAPNTYPPFEPPVYTPAVGEATIHVQPPAGRTDSCFNLGALGNALPATDGTFVIPYAWLHRLPDGYSVIVSSGTTHVP